MIKLYKKWKLFKTYDNFEMKNIKEIQIIFRELMIKNLLEKVEIWEMVEEPYSYTMRKNWFILKWY